MRWLAYEEAALVRLTRFPRSATPRERLLTLGAIRLGALSLALLLIGLLGASLSAITFWSTAATAGGVLFVAGLALLTLAMALLTILIVVYRD